MWNLLILSLYNLQNQKENGISVKGGSQRTEFVKDDSQGPDIRGKGVRLGFNDFGTHVGWSTQYCLCVLLRCLQYFSDAEVAEFDDSGLSEEYVGSFEVTMDDFPIVNVFDCKGELCKSVEYLLFRN